MRTFLHCLLVATIVLHAVHSAHSAAPQTIVCIGDSITQGAQLTHDNHRWPTQLQMRLPKKATVYNLGVGGATLLQGTDRPYLQTQRWLEGPVVKAHVVIIVLGTNDTVLNDNRKPWEQIRNLDRDLRTMVDSIRERHGVPHILLCSPPPSFPRKAGLSQARSDDLAQRVPRALHLRNAYRNFAETDPSVEYVDLSRVLTSDQVSDGVHPNSFGQEALANHFARLLRMPFERNAVGSSTALASQLVDLGTQPTQSRYHGFTRFDFVLPGTDAPCIVVLPHRQALGRPWIWRARFFDHQPLLDLALLDLGFHLAYCDVHRLYGNGVAVTRWSDFYDFMHEGLGLGTQPVLQGLSRGGLPTLNFAIGYPQKVGALVLDNPVCDFRSWPGGASTQRQENEWAEVLEAYAMDEAQAQTGEIGPLGKLAPLAQAKIPMHVLIGTADDVVPPAENGERLVTEYSALAGPVTPWRKPGAKHHPHGLDPVDPLVRVLLHDLGLDHFAPASVATPSVEFRGQGAGWGSDTPWDAAFESMCKTAQANPDLQVVFLGDSITQGLTGARSRLSFPNGTRPFDKIPGAISLGLSGDRTEHVLYRMEHGALQTLDPRVIVLNIGINNINTARHSGAEVAHGLETVVFSLLVREPQATVLICGPFPTGRSPQHPKRKAIAFIHKKAEQLAGKDRVQYIDLRPLFLNDEGYPNERMAPDTIHITPAGQLAWMEAIAPLIEQALQE